MIFAYFLGMCSYLAVSKNVKTAMGLGVAVTFVLAITLPVNYLLENYILKAGALSWLGESFADVDLSFLSLIFFIAVVAAMVQLVEDDSREICPRTLQYAGYLPAAHCSELCHLGRFALHAAAVVPRRMVGPRSTGSGSGIGWLLAIVGIAAIREKMAYSNVPAPLKGHRHYFHRYGAHGHSLHEFPRHQTVKNVPL